MDAKTKSNSFDGIVALKKKECGRNAVSYLTIKDFRIIDGSTDLQAAQENSPVLAFCSMFKKEDTLPGAKVEPAIVDRNAQTRLGQGCADMRG